MVATDDTPVTEHTTRTSGGSAVPTNLQRRVGVVLAGGFSTRFGDADKALAPVDGTPMLRRVVARVGEVTDAVVVNCRADQRDGFAAVLSDLAVPVAFAIDPVDDEGPLAGLAASLAVHDAPVTVLVACDMPFVDPRCLATLCDHRRDAGADATVPRLDGQRQPAQAALSTGPARSAARNVLARGATSLHSLYEQLEVATVDERTLDRQGFVGSLRDVNTRETLSGEQ